MPPKRSGATSKDLVTTGPKHLRPVDAAPRKKGESVAKPTTTRALVLRNGKYGAMGTGELVLLRKKLSGKEKLNLLAEDLVQKAILPPFRLEQCLNIASSQRDAYLDDIANLKDPTLFCDLIREELEARSPVDPQQRDNVLKNPSHIAYIVATRIHNAYLLAAGWKIVLETFVDLAANGLTNDNVKIKLKNNPQFRLRYLILYDMIGSLVDLSQANFSVLATTTAHYARYFKKLEGTAPDEPDVRFDWNGLRDACLSFIDYIIIELCFPRAPYPRGILFSILSDAVEEAPKDAKRFSQALWDAVGDFSVSVQLHSLVEAPLLGPDGSQWKNTPRSMPEEYERWIDAQIYSAEASMKYANFKDLIYPLEKTKNQSVLNEMWKLTNLNYKSVSRKDIDALWALPNALDIPPQWHAFYMPFLGGEDDSDDDNQALTVTRRRGALVESDSDDSTHGSMPSLQTVSGSCEESSDDSSECSEDGPFDEYSDDESGYDTGEEEDLRDMLRTAMDAAHEADFYDPTCLNPDLDPLAQRNDRSDNPFLKLLGSLRGRLFSSNPKLKVGERTGLKRTKAAEDNEARKTTLEEIEEDDEGDDALQTPKKKKKKKKSKKKKPTMSLDQIPTSPSLAPVAVEEPCDNTSQQNARAQRTQSQSGAPKVIPNSKSASTASLVPHPVEPTIAQSARSYIKAEQLDVQKSKTKTRSDQASIFSTEATNKKKSIFARFRLGGIKETSEEEQKKAKRSWFGNLSKRATNYMHQLLRTSQDEKQGLAPMKWDHFVALMTEMGFSVHPEAAGSRVRFDPPDKRDRSIIIHKPHPDPTLQPVKLKDIASRLQRYYGWNKEDFLAQAK